MVLDIVCDPWCGIVGAADDLRRVTQILYQMVQVYGMNEKVGQVAFPREDNGWPSEKPYSNATSEVCVCESTVCSFLNMNISLMSDHGCGSA